MAYNVLMCRSETTHSLTHSLESMENIWLVVLHI